jgi:phospholipid-translocating P-type ATPase (flippase)
MGEADTEAALVSMEVVTPVKGKANAEKTANTRQAHGMANHRFIHVEKGIGGAAHVQGGNALKASTEVRRRKETGFTSNFIRTSKYRAITFIPQNLLEQFYRKANFYFLIVAIVSVTDLSPKTPVVSVAPLVFVLGVSMLKEFFEDRARKKMDKQINNTLVQTWRDGAFRDVRWRDLVVGDTVRIVKNGGIPADVLVLKTSGEQSDLAIETSNLDGETNLKTKKAVAETGSAVKCADDGMDYPSQLANCVIESSGPEKKLNFTSWTGTLRYEGVSEPVPLTMDQLCLRGCSMRNTKWAVCLVLFTGKQTKLMLNSRMAKLKRSNVDKIVDKILYVLFVIQFFLCSFGALMNWYFMDQHAATHWYLPYVLENATSADIAEEGALSWFTYLVLLDIFIPISLYVSMELVKFVQSFYINWDLNMYYEEADAPAKARTSNLNEELGQVQYIFSDKTGTLTGNRMDFSMCSVNGTLYGQTPNDIEMQVKPEFESVVPHVPANHPPFDASFPFKDSRLLQALMISEDHKRVDDTADSVRMFLLNMALNHTILVQAEDCEKDHIHDWKQPGGLEFQAASPDEKALLLAARHNLFLFRGRSPCEIKVGEEVVQGEMLHLTILGKEVRYELIDIFKFNSTRARMSVIVREVKGATDDGQPIHGKILLFCKGADNKVYKLLAEKSRAAVWQETKRHLEVFSVEGLRTLVLAHKELEEKSFEQWLHTHKEAKNAVDNRAKLVEDSQSLIENELVYGGATAIEDKLQEGVPQAIQQLMKANIKIWVLTGDKVTTAINIGRSCRLVTPEMDRRGLIMITPSDEDADDVARPQTMKLLAEAWEKVKDAQDGESNLCVVLSGRALGYIFLDSSKKKRVRSRSRSKSQSKVSSVSAHEREALKVEAERLRTLLLAICVKCRSVLCCRTSPHQKAEVVNLVKHRIHNAITLAVGDGANDVSMIKSAHVGVGIVGLEGMQAVMAADYAIGRFRYLETLLFVHGSWSYSRISSLILYSFYKNIAIAVTQIWFAMYSGWSAQMFYDAYAGSAYNMVFTSFPILFVAIFNQDISRKTIMSYPEQYIMGQENRFFSIKLLMWNFLEASIQSLGLFYSAMWLFSECVQQNGQMEDHWVISHFYYSNLVLLVTFRVVLESTTFNWVNGLFIVLSVLSWFAFGIAYSSIISITPDMYMVAQRTFVNTNFWLGYLLVPVALIMPEIAIRYIRRTYFYNRNDIIAEIDHGYGEGKIGETGRSAKPNLHASNGVTSRMASVELTSYKEDKCHSDQIITLKNTSHEDGNVSFHADVDGGGFVPKSKNSNQEVTESVDPNETFTPMGSESHARLSPLPKRQSKLISPSLDQGSSSSDSSD